MELSFLITFKELHLKGPEGYLGINDEDTMLMTSLLPFNPAQQLGGPRPTRTRPNGPQPPCNGHNH